MGKLHKRNILETNTVEAFACICGCYCGYCSCGGDAEASVNVDVDDFKYNERYDEKMGNLGIE